MTPEDLNDRVDTLSRHYVDTGVTFDYAGEERAFPLDLVPRIITADDWDVVDRGVKQRVSVLEMLLADIYSGEASGISRVVRDGVQPWRIIASSEHFHRCIAGLRTPNDVRIHVSGIDLIRDESGTFRVLEDNVRVPSGVSYVISNRRAMTTVFPESFEEFDVRPVADYPSAAAGRAPGRRTRRHPRPHGRRAHPWRVQLRLLRAHAARPHDGRRARRGSQTSSARAAWSGCVRPVASSRST